jgi:hypothetical protein
MEIILKLIVAVYALAIAMQIKGYMTSIKVPKTEVAAGFMAPQNSL